MEFYPARQIVPYNLWIGSAGDSANSHAALRKGLTLVVNCTRDVPASLKGVRHARIPIDDDPAEVPTMVAHLGRVTRLIDSHLRKGGGVLVHCYAGISRSASVVAAFLMRREGLTPRQAMTRIRRLKPETFGRRPVFVRALEGFHKSLSRVKAAGTVRAVRTVRTGTRGAAASTPRSRARR